MGITPLFAQTAAGPPAEPPLLIVDSAIAGNLDYLPPEDVDSIAILKGTDAVAYAALFGKSGTGGVILIKTKNSRQVLPVATYLSLHNIELTPYTVLMSDNRLIADPRHFRIDTSQIIQVTRTTFSNLPYPDTACKNVQLIKLYHKQKQETKPPPVPIRKKDTPGVPSPGFKNPEAVRSSGARSAIVHP